MVESLRFHPLVAEDLVDAVGWYDKISVELGKRFRSAVDERFDSVESNPKSYGLIRATIRAAMVRGFPYVVLFESESACTMVLSVVHAASDSKKWAQRRP